MEILEQLIRETEDREISAAHIGFFTTAVVSSGAGGERCGLASTLRGGICSGSVSNAGALAGLPVKELARRALCGGGVEASLGMAAINSALPTVEYETLNAEELIAERAKGKNVAVIGHFPFTERLRALAANLWVLELEPKDALDLPPARKAELLPRADVVAVTALTLINGTFSGVLTQCRSGAFKILLGPSAPLSPVLFGHGLDAVGGTRVEDIPALTRALGEGANFRGLPGKKMVVIRKAKQA